MDETVTVRDVLDRQFVGVAEGDPVSGAAALMREEDSASAVVLRGGEPVGVVRAADVVALVGDGAAPSETTVEEIMVEPRPTVRATDRLGEARAAVAGSETRRAVVLDDEGVVGVLSPADLLIAGARREPPGDDPASATEAVPGNDDYATQGVCEICGALASDLIDRNGQLVCADCRDL